MEILQLISEQTPAVALALVVMWFYNKLVLDILKERKEIIDNLRAERAEWIGVDRAVNLQLLEIIRSTTQAISENKSETHALRNKLTEFMLTFSKRSRGEGTGD